MKATEATLESSERGMPQHTALDVSAYSAEAARNASTEPFGLKALMMGMARRSWRTLLLFTLLRTIAQVAYQGCSNYLRTEGWLSQSGVFTYFGLQVVEYGVEAVVFSILTWPIAGWIADAAWNAFVLDLLDYEGYWVDRLICREQRSVHSYFHAVARVMTSTISVAVSAAFNLGWLAVSGQVSASHKWLFIFFSLSTTATFVLAVFRYNDRMKEQQERYSEMKTETGELLFALNEDIRSMRNRARVALVQRERDALNWESAKLILRSAAGLAPMDALMRLSMAIGILGLGLLAVYNPKSFPLTEYYYFAEAFGFFAFSVDRAMQGYRSLLADHRGESKSLRKMAGHRRRVQPEAFDPSQLIFESLEYTHDGHSRPALLLQTTPLVMETGEIIAIVGKSGAGKTTFAKVFTEQVCLSGLRCRLTTRTGVLRDAAVAVSLAEETQHFDQDAKDHIPRKHTNLRRWLGHPRDSEVIELMEALRLRSTLDLDRNIPKTLSGGERIRLAFLRLMLHASRRSEAIVVLDEAENGLAAEDAALLLPVIRRQFANRLVLMVTHSPLTTDFADKVIRITESNEDGIGHIVMERDRPL